MLKLMLMSSEENQESRGDAEGKCIGAKLTTSLLRANAYGLTNNGNAMWQGFTLLECLTFVVALEITQHWGLVSMFKGLFWPISFRLTRRVLYKLYN